MCNRHAIADLEYSVAQELTRPFYLLRPRMFIDGDRWCALYGENIQDGVAGFGESPYLATYAFDKAWWAKLPAAQPKQS